MARARAPQHNPQHRGHAGARTAGKPAAAPSQSLRHPRPSDRGSGPTQAALVLQLQRDQGNSATSLMLQRQPKTATTPATEAGALLEGVGKWADEQKDTQHKISAAAVVGLDPKQATSVKQAVTKLTALITPLQAGATALDTPYAGFKKAMKLAEDAKKANKGPDVADRLEAKHILTQSRTAVGEAKAALLKVKGGIDVTKIVKDVTTVETWMTDVGNLTDVIKQLNEFLKAIQLQQADVHSRATALRRITFLLNGFLEVNQPRFTGTPSAQDIKDLKGKLHGGINDDFNAVFGGTAEFALFTEYADLLAQQLDIRDEMAAAGAPATGPVPSAADAQAFFTTMATKPPDQVFTAYMSFAAAYFYHRIVANLADLQALVPDLMAQAASITGTRPLVCTGYATIGAQLISWAGGHTDTFIVGIRASDEMVRNATTLDDAHALAKVTLRGKTAFISNGSIVNTENEGIGPDAVAWDHKDNPIFLGRGQTMKGAVDAAMAKMMARKKKLKP